MQYIRRNAYGGFGHTGHAGQAGTASNALDNLYNQFGSSYLDSSNRFAPAHQQQTQQYAQALRQQMLDPAGYNQANPQVGPRRIQETVNMPGASKHSRNSVNPFSTGTTNSASRSIVRPRSAGAVGVNPFI